MKNDQRIELTTEQLERIATAYELSKEVVAELNLPDFRERRNELFDNKHHYCYKRDNGKDISLYAQINTNFGYINFDFSLINFAYDAILLTQELLTNEISPKHLKPNVIYELKKREIDILKLFNLEESEVKEVIAELVKEVLKMFILNTPNFAEAAIVDAYGHSKIGYYLHQIKPMMKEHWKNLGLPDDFNLITQEQLDEVRKYDLGRKRWFLGDKKQFLNMNTLADEADNLRKQYGKAKKDYFVLKASFERINRNSKEKWIDKWIEIRFEDFPMLNSAALDVIENYRAFELTAIHLGDKYGYDEESMRKKIASSRKLNRKK